MSLSGLTSKQVKQQRLLHGSNKQGVSHNSFWRIFIEVVKEPMVLLLIIACFFYFFMQQLQEGIIMAMAILIVSGISVYQQIRSEGAIEALNKLTQQKTTVLRDDNIKQVLSEDLVTGDVMQVAEGQLVSADAEILEFNDLSVDESLLTGESFPVVKNAIGQLLFSGTTITSGMAWLKVTRVGKFSKIGQLGVSMESINKEKTPLQKQTGKFVKQMAFFGITAFLFVWLYNYLASGDIVKGLMHGLTLAMAVLPEEIPVALSTFMALGAYRMIKKHVLAKHPQTVEALGAATIICVDKTGTITENKMQVVEVYDFTTEKIIVNLPENSNPSTLELLRIAMLASETDPFDPMEKAIHDCYNAAHPGKGFYSMIKEYPLSGIHPMMTHVYAGENSERIISCKGAPEGILAQSELTEAETQKVNDCLKEMAAKGNRVLAIAKGNIGMAPLPESQADIKLTFLGLIALSDPPKKNSKEVIKAFYNSGIDVKMITGDYQVTAMSIAAQIDLKNSDHCITGNQITSMTDDELQQALKTTSVYARVMPETKLRLINILKKSGEVVAMTGDGVNDGPALKAAHIGVAMGIRGSEVARKAASLILTNDNLEAMVSAVTFGRNIYANLKKAIQYIISIHIPLISVVTLPVLLGWEFPNIFSPVHVIFLELIMGPTCSIVYENEPLDTKLMNQPPRKITDSLFTWRELSKSVIQGIVIAVGLLILMHYLSATGSSETMTRTMVFTTLVFSNILLTLTGRSNWQTIATTIRYKNHLVPVAIGLTFVLLLLSIYFHPVQEVFRFNQLSLNQLLLCGGMASVCVIWIEFFKIKNL